MKKYRNAYQITTHVGSAQTSFLLSKIYSERDIYLVYIDRKSIDAHQEMLDAFRGCENVSFLHDTNISWASKSILDTTLNGIFWLCRNAAWDRYTLISGQDLPVHSPDIRPDKFKFSDNQIACWSEISDLNRGLVEGDDVDSLAFTASTPTKDIIFSKRFSKVFVHPETHFRYKNHHDLMRVRYDYLIDNVINVMSIANIKPFYLQMLQNWLDAGHRLGFGQAWVRLTREFCEWIMASPDVGVLYNMASRFLFPDESFFQTLVLNSPFSHTNRTHSLFDHEKQGVLDGGVLEHSALMGCAFARKLDMSNIDSLAPVWEELNGVSLYEPTADFKSKFQRSRPFFL